MANEVRILIFDDLAELYESQRPGSGSREGKLSNAGGHAARALHDFFFRKFAKSRAGPTRRPDAPVPFRSTLQYRRFVGAGTYNETNHCLAAV
jgi:hypothetical protein